MKLGILILGGWWAILALISGTVGAEGAFPRYEVTSMSFLHLLTNTRRDTCSKLLLLLWNIVIV